VSPSAVLKSAKTLVVIDWPSKEVPELLARAGFEVIVRGGPGSTDYSAYELTDGKVVARPLGRQPEHADVVYSYRPLSELPGIISMARGLGASTIWTQSGLSGPGVKDVLGCWLPEDDLKSAQQLIEAAGLNHISQPYIGDVVREMGLAATK
jgi:predicted CoA-binding protein